MKTSFYCTVCTEINRIFSLTQYSIMYFPEAMSSVSVPSLDCRRCFASDDQRLPSGSRGVTDPMSGDGPLVTVGRSQVAPGRFHLSFSSFSVGNQMRNLVFTLREDIQLRRGPQLHENMLSLLYHLESRGRQFTSSPTFIFHFFYKFDGVQVICLHQTSQKTFLFS